MICKRIFQVCNFLFIQETKYEENIPGNTLHNSILYSYAANVSIHQLFVGRVVPEIKKKKISI